MRDYCAQKEIPPRDVHFHNGIFFIHNGIEINPNQRPDDLSLKDNDLIFVCNLANANEAVRRNYGVPIPDEFDQWRAARNDFADPLREQGRRPRNGFRGSRGRDRDRR